MGCYDDLLSVGVSNNSEKVFQYINIYTEEDNKVC